MVITGDFIKSSIIVQGDVLCFLHHALGQSDVLTVLRIYLLSHQFVWYLMIHFVLFRTV